ncbi:MAG: hypothetical protein FWD79_10870 [Desulfobulbus sp.]|nr:hypothetical protein [Desulfobulbus sp.]
MNTPLIDQSNIDQDIGAAAMDWADPIYAFFIGLCLLSLKAQWLGRQTMRKKWRRKKAR